MESRVSTMPISKLQHYHDNARQGDIGAITVSLAALGQYRRVIVNEGTKTGKPWEVLAGNHVMDAALALGWEELKVEIVDVTERVARKINLYDNRTSDLATDDEALLLESLEKLEGDLDDGIYDEDDLDALRELLAGPKDLDDLEDEYGKMTDADSLKTVTMKVTPFLADQWSEHRRGFDSDSEALEALLDRSA